MKEITLVGLVAAARRLDLTVDTVRYLADTGEIGTVLRDTARRRLFFPADIEALARRRKAEKKAKR